jgi:hypothetical protein
MTEMTVDDRAAFDAAIKAGEDAHLLTVGSPNRTAFRVAMGSLDRHGRWHAHRLDAFVIWRGCRRSVPEMRERSSEAFWRGLAGALPRRLAYFATIRVGVHATTGEYGHQIVPDLTFLDALKRWEM